MGPCINKTLRRRVLCGATLAILLAAFACRAQADTLLRWKFTPGARLHYAIATDTTQVMHIGDTMIDIKMVQHMETTWAVEAVDDDGTATIQQTIDRLRLDVSPGTGQKSIKYDSDNNEKNEGAEMLLPLFDAIVGNSTTIRVTPRGEIKDLKLSEEMLAAVKKSALSGMGGPFSEDGMRQLISRSMLSFPAEALAPGSRWSSVIETANPIFGKLLTEMKYEYAGQEKRGDRTLDKLDAGMTMRFEQSPDAQAKVSVTQQSSAGTLYFDNVAGQLVDSSLKSKVVMQIEADGMPIEQDITMLVTMKKTDPGVRSEK